MIRALIAVLAILGCGSAYAQIGYYKFSFAAADVKVFLSDEELRKTSDFIFSGAKVEGNYKLKVVKKGFNDLIKDIRINSDELLELNIELEYAEVFSPQRGRPERILLKEESGKLILLSDPPGMLVQVDKLSWEQTPVTLVNYPAGPRRIKIGPDSLNLTLLPYGIKRLFWQEGRISEINAEIQRKERGAVTLESVQIAFSKIFDDLQNWKTTKIPKFPNGGLKDPIFKIDEEEWRLLCFLKFSNSSNDTVAFAQEFKIVADDGDVHKHESMTRLAPRVRNYDWLYHTLRKWSPGFYSIKISDDRGPMAIIYFSLHY
jgi:hypothetical protein